jgi:hypothetical protein
MERKKCFIILLLAEHRGLKWVKGLNVCLWRYKTENREINDFSWLKKLYHQYEDEKQILKVLFFITETVS